MHGIGFTAALCRLSIILYIIYLFSNSYIRPVRMYVCLGGNVPLYKELIYKPTLLAPSHCRHALTPAHHQPSRSQRQYMLHSRSSENNSLMRVLILFLLADSIQTHRLDVLAVAWTTWMHRPTNSQGRRYWPPARVPMHPCRCVPAQYQSRLTVPMIRRLNHGVLLWRLRVKIPGWLSINLCLINLTTKKFHRPLCPLIIN